MKKTRYSWKKITTFFIFSLPLSLVGQDSQFLSKTTSTKAVRNSSSQPGDILFSQRFTGTRKILFLLIKYPGDTGGIISNSQAQSHKNLVIANLERNAYDSLSVTIDITPILEMPNPDTYYQTVSNKTMRVRADAVLKAEQAGFDLYSYDREVIFTRNVWGASGALGTMNKRTVLISYNRAFITLHELGHSNGWRHTNFWKVSGGSPIALNGTEIVYGDKFDLMGGSAGAPPHTPNDYHHFNPWYKHRVGWIPPESILTVTNSGTYTIQALASTPQTGGSTTKYTALKIKKDPYRDYWIFFRSLEELVNKGPVITEIYNDNIRAPLLLDMTPGSQNNDWKDADLRVDSTFSDTQNGITVKTVSRSSSEVQVEITVDANALANIDKIPVMDVINPLNGETVTGIVDYQVTAFDPDFGTTDGAGIDKVKLFLHHGGDALAVALIQNLDPPTPVGIKEFTAPPYFWRFDTTPFIDGIHYIIIKTTSLDGAVHYVWFEHFVDNFATPAAPSLSFPSDNSTNISTNSNLDWNFSTGATSYRLQVSDVSDFSTTGVDQSNLTSTSFQVSGLSTGTTYYWRIKAKNAVGISNWSPAWQFSTMAAGSAPAAPALSSPIDNATGISTNFSLVWNTASGATSYQLQVSTVADFSTTFINQSGITSFIYPINGLLNNTTYYWRVNATNANGTSPYSTAWEFTTIVAAPAASVLLKPSDNATDIATDTTLVWASSNGATLYQLQVSTVSNFSPIKLDKSGLTTTSFRLTDLSNSTLYFWRVKASNAGGESPWSTVRRFTTIMAGPAAPLLSSPADNATDIPTTPILVWNTSGGATSYDLQISTQSNFATLEVNKNDLPDTTFQATGLSNSTTQYWRVRSANAGGTSPWSAVWKFTTIVAAPAAPGLSSPADKALEIAIDTTLVWNSSTGGVSYGLQVSTTSDFSTTVVEQNELTETSFQVNDLENETTYFWHVNATNAGGTSPWSTVRRFTTEQVTSVETDSGIPSDFRLGQNYPNPFNPTTNITFDVPKSEYVILKVYTLLGTEVATLVSGNLSAGKYTIKFDASNLSSGLFFYKLQTNLFVEIRKMLLVR